MWFLKCIFSDSGWLKDFPHFTDIQGLFFSMNTLMLNKWEAAKDFQTFVTFKLFLNSTWILWCRVRCELQQRLFHILYIHKVSLSEFSDGEWEMTCEWMPSTYSTFIEFFLSMNSQMFNEMWNTTKRLSTVHTFVWFLSSVSALMISKWWDMAKGFPHSIHFVRFLSTVAYLMSSKGWAKS